MSATAAHEPLEVVEVTTDSSYYRRALELRREAFFRGCDDYRRLLFDAAEAESIHLVSIRRSDGRLAGYLRLTYESPTEARASQLVVDPELRGNRVWVALALRLAEIARASGRTKVLASARPHGVGLYSKIGFRPVGDPYPSIKTGIIHQAMEWDISAEGWKRYSP